MKGGVSHGGDLGEVQRRFPDAPRPWIDLSTGINPVPYPLPALPADAWTRLPSRAQHQALIAAAARRYGVEDLSTIVAAPGTQALIQLLPRLHPPADVAIVGRTYEEHELCWRRHGHTVRTVESVEQVRAEEILVVVNPDNPTGRLLELKPRDRLTIVDEAFVDFLPATASLATGRRPNIIVLRSFGKAYGLAGIRLGFAIADAKVVERIERELGPWAVSGPALEIGTHALDDAKWLQEAGQRLGRDVARLDELLKGAGFAVLGGTPLFRLARHDTASAVSEVLGRHGIHVRSFAREPSWLRFGLPADQSAFERIERALAQFR